MRYTRKFLFALYCLSLIVYTTAIVSAQKKQTTFDTKSLDAFVEQQMKEWSVPGVAIAIVKHGEVLYEKGYGFRHLAQKKPVTPHTLFAIASCTKAFTATSVGMLVDSGKLAWDKPVRDYFPAFQLYDHYATTHVTLRDMLSHRTGLPRHDAVWYGSPLSRKELVTKLRSLQPSKELREAYQYNNLMFMTAGHVVETVSNIRWENFIQRNIFEPLEMKRTNISYDEMLKQEDRAQPYRKKADGSLKEIPFYYNETLAPAGAINSSAHDLANWVIMNLAKGKFKGKQIVPATVINEVHKPVVIASATSPFQEVSHSSYAMGWIVSAHRGHQVIQHGGAIDGFVSRVALLPHDSAGVVILMNLGQSSLPGVLTNVIIDKICGLPDINWSSRTKERDTKAEAEKAAKQRQTDSLRVPGTRTTHPIADFVGTYQHPGYGSLTITRQADSLVLEYNGQKAFLRHYHYNTFQAIDAGSDSYEGELCSFELNPKGLVERFLFPFEPALPAIIFHRMPLKTAK